MTTRHTVRLLALTALLPAFAMPASAQDDSYFYGGLSLGQSRAKIDEERISAGLLSQGLTTIDFNRDERGTGYKLFGGYQFNRMVGIEGGYFDLGRFGFDTTTTPAGTLAGQIRLRGLNLDLVGTVPVTDRFALIGRIGGQMARANDRFSGTGAVGVLNPNPSRRETHYKFGGGLQYAFSPSLIMRAEAERYRINDAVGNKGDVNLFSVGLVIPFGRAEPRRVVAAPAYVEPAPMPIAPPVVAPPPPVVVAPTPAPMPPERRRVSFSAESLFTFDRSEVKPEGRVALDKFAAEMRGTQFDVITVEGHTDRLGSTAYNQRLSTERAEAVKRYLVSSGGFDAGKIQVAGKGESSPVTQPGDCKGNTPSPKLIACLQPDRRVVIEVVGTR